MGVIGEVGFGQPRVRWSGTRAGAWLWGVPAAWSAAICAPMYVTGATAHGPEPLLLLGVLLAAYLLPRAVAWLNAGVAVAGYAPVAVMADGAAGVIATLCLAATAVVAVLIVATLRGRLAGLTRGESRSDPLTRLPNRLAFDELLAHETARCQRSDRPLTVLLLDLDAFGLVNDALGRPGGDRTLRDVAQVLRTQMRDSDVLAHLGGDEFGVLLPACGTGDALRRAEHIRSLLERTAGRWPAAVTASIGVATVPGHAASVAELLAAAGAALLEAKEDGRNRVVAAPPAAGDQRIRGVA